MIISINYILPKLRFQKLKFCKTKLWWINILEIFVRGGYHNFATSLVISACVAITKGKTLVPVCTGLISGWVTIWIKYPVPYFLGSRAGVVNINHAFHLHYKFCMWIEFQSISKWLWGFSPGTLVSSLRMQNRLPVYSICMAFEGRKLY